MRICLEGTGAMGGMMAGRPALAGNRVTAVGQGPQLEAIRRRGLPETGVSSSGGPHGDGTSTKT